MTIKNIGVFLALVVVMAGLPAFGQASMTSTTFSNAVAASDSCFYVASATGIVTTGFNSPNVPWNNSSIIYADKEAIIPSSVNGTYVCGRRGQLGTKPAAHASGATVWVGAPQYFDQDQNLPSGSCTATAELVLPRVNIPTGYVMNCVNSKWVKQTEPVPFNATDGYIFIPGSACSSAVGTTAYASGYPKNTVPATGNPVYQVTTDTTAGTVEVTCPINLPSRLTSGKGVTLTAAALHYGVQTTALSSIAAATVKSVTYPTSTSGGASAAGTVASAGGSLTVTPGTLQTGTTTSGQCYSEKISFGTPIAVNTANQQVTLDQVFTTAGTTATTLQVCGVGVWYSIQNQ